MEIWKGMLRISYNLRPRTDSNRFPSRLRVETDAISKLRTEKLAIEAWALYSYNLHKATYHGLEALPCRKNKRNFILGRGSFAGMFRYAALWSGDNASTWEFWRITIPQVLSMGLNGVCISGSDIGGFEPNGGDQYCNPELLIRWYAGAFLLPWLRNHYNSTYNDNGKQKKWFQVSSYNWVVWIGTNIYQEPHQYLNHFDKHCERDKLWGRGYLYYGVQYIARYFVQLRYSLLQLLYDTIFANQIDGMPVARSMVSTSCQHMLQSLKLSD